MRGKSGAQVFLKLTLIELKEYPPTPQISMLSGVIEASALPDNIVGYSRSQKLVARKTVRNPAEHVWVYLQI